MAHQGGEAGFTQHQDTREADPLLAGAPYKLIVIDEKKDVVLFEQRGFRGELAREVAKEWADEIRRIGAVKWVDPKTPGFDKAVPDRRM